MQEFQRISFVLFYKPLLQLKSHGSPDLNKYRKIEMIILNSFTHSLVLVEGEVGGTEMFELIRYMREPSNFHLLKSSEIPQAAKQLSRTRHLLESATQI